MKKTLQKYKTKWMVGNSSPFLIKKMLKNIDFSQDSIIVQYGSGKAVFVKEILKQMSDNSQLYVFEIDENCKQYIQWINDSRLSYIEDSAENIEKYISKDVDYIISTLPFASLPWEVLPKIITVSEKKLKQGGIFLQYQYFLTDKKKIEQIFWKKSKVSFEPINIPPAFIYKIIK